MEDIELEEEVVSNSELRDLKPIPSKTWEQRQTVLKGSSTGDNKHASQSGRIRRKKRSLPGQLAGTFICKNCFEHASLVYSI